MVKRTGTLFVIITAATFIGGAADTRPAANSAPAAGVPQDEARPPLGPQAKHGLASDRLAATWDEGIPLGNGMVGALIWKNGSAVRLSLDRADLWDLRPMKNLDAPDWKFSWVVEQWKKANYRAVQEKFDAPYDAEPAPTKIPAAALEFEDAGGEAAVRLDLAKALGTASWPDGRVLESFVHAEKPVGWFRWKGVPRDFKPVLRPPAYAGEKPGQGGDSLSGQDLRRLGYKQGTITPGTNALLYRQNGWGDFSYTVAVVWRPTAEGAVEGVWSISSSFSDARKEPAAPDWAIAELRRGFDAALAEHAAWWAAFWSRSSLAVPDPLLEKQWYLEQYKFGSAARRGAPPISLQAVWTADNGRIPPWKGDFHHDLNTQLSYWPAYSGNHLEEAAGFLDWLWDQRAEFRRYTRAYFGKDGLNVPGVSTLLGQPMGGWIQYSFGPTVAAWLAQHFFLQWRFGRDRAFLAERAYPWIRDTALFLEQLSIRDESGRRRLPASSSPEIFDNSDKAWFAETTNFDLSLIRWTFAAAAELAAELGLRNDAARWKGDLEGWPDFAVDPESGLMFAPGVPYKDSHRHFSHAMAIHPLGLIDPSRGDEDAGIIRRTLATLDRVGPDYWCGYSYAWLGNLKARAFDGEGAARALRDFASCFCLPNSFHANGDQCRAGKSKFTYRPFTLEGNFAFAAGLQEMLLQSHTGTLRVFPAVPAAWGEAAFEGLRADGAFLVSARREGGTVREVRVTAEKGGTLRLANPFSGPFKLDGREIKTADAVLVLKTKAGRTLVLSR